MRHLGRVTAIVLELLMIQFTVVSGVMACPSGREMEHAMNQRAASSHAAGQHHSPEHPHHCLHCETPCGSSGCCAGGPCYSAEIATAHTPSPTSLLGSAERVVPRTESLRSPGDPPELPPPRL